MSTTSGVSATHCQACSSIICTNLSGFLPQVKQNPSSMVTQPCHNSPLPFSLSSSNTQNILVPPYAKATISPTWHLSRPCHNSFVWFILTLIPWISKGFSHRLPSHHSSSQLIMGVRAESMSASFRGSQGLGSSASDVQVTTMPCTHRRWSVPIWWTVKHSQLEWQFSESNLGTLAHIGWARVLWGERWPWLPLQSVSHAPVPCVPVTRNNCGPLIDLCPPSPWTFAHAQFFQFGTLFPALHCLVNPTFPIGFTFLKPQSWTRRVASSSRTWSALVMGLLCKDLSEGFGQDWTHKCPMVMSKELRSWFQAWLTSWRRSATCTLRPQFSSSVH